MHILAPRVIMAFALVATLALPCAARAAGTNAAAKASLASMDASHSRQDTAAENAALLARLKQYQDELGKLRLQLSLQLEELSRWQAEIAKIESQLAQMQADAPPAALPAAPRTPSKAPQAATKTAASVPVSAIAPQAVTRTAGAQKTRPELPAHPPQQQETKDWQTNLFIAAGLMLLALFAWMGLRRHQKTSSNHETGRPGAISQPAASIAIDRAAPVIDAPVKAVALVIEAPAEPVETVYDEKSMLEEARLYVTHGHLAVAVAILNEINQRNPGNAEAWSLLLSSYSSLGKAAEFEASAGEFLARHKDNPVCHGIRALGRTFDKNNPLYADAGLAHGSTVQRGTIGDILLEMGFISENNLHTCLVAYDPKRDGRLGGYLVRRKFITLAQLDEALERQQSNDAEETPAALPSLGEMENFAAGFDPNKHGSINRFLTNGTASSPEQTDNLLQQQATGR